jgi:Polysaccharide lyase
MRLSWVLAVVLAPMAAARAAELSEVERAPRAEAYAIQEVDDPQAKGEALRFELRAGDCAKPADCAAHRERAELGESWRAPAGSEVRYQFKLLVPSDYPELAPHQILGQWHDGERPVLSNRYETGRFWIDLMTEPGDTTHRFELDRFQKGKWQKLTYLVRWADDETGSLRVWLNKKRVIDYDGPTLVRGSSDGPRFKLGIYRGAADKLEGPAPTQIVYFDGYDREVEDEG